MDAIHTQVFADEDVLLLYDAAVQGDMAVVEALVEKGTSVHDRHVGGDTVLHKAAFFGREQIVEILIKAGAKIEDKNDYGNTPLHLAAYSGRRPAVENLLYHDADFEAANNFRETPIHISAFHGTIKCLHSLVSAGADVNSPNNVEALALHGAAQEGHFQTCEALLNAGAWVNHCDNYGDTALHRAVRRGHREIILLLLDRGAEANLPNREQRAPFDMVQVEEEGPSLSEMSRKTKEELLYIASETGRDNCVISLCKAGAHSRWCKVTERRRKERSEDTPLHKAAEAGHELVCKILMHQGIETGLMNWFGKTAAELTDKNNIKAMLNDPVKHMAVAAMKEKQAKAAQASGGGGGAGGTMAGGGGGGNGSRADAMFNAVAARQTVHAKVRWGNTPELEEELLTNPNRVNQRDMNGNTPLHIATQNGHVAVTQLLVTKGADINAVNTQGRTPLFYAFGYGYMEVGEFLRRIGADDRIVDKVGHTCYDHWYED